MNREIPSPVRPALKKTCLHILLVASFLTAAFLAGQYYFHRVLGPSVPLRFWMWFNGIFFLSLFLLGVGTIAFLLRRGSRVIEEVHQTKMEQIAAAPNPEVLSRNAGDLILLLDQPLGSGRERRRRRKDSDDSPPTLLASPLPLPEDEQPDEDPKQNPEAAPVSGHGVKFHFGDQKIEAAGQDVYDNIIEDIEDTERKLNRIELSNSKRRYRIVSEFSSDWTYWQGPDREMQYVSPSCQEITGYPSRDFYREPALLYDVIHPDDRPLWEVHNEEELREGNPGPIEFRIFTPEKEARWVSHFCKPVHDHDGEFLGVCGSNRDITGQKRAEEAVKVKTEQLLRSNKELEQFAYVASHDLQTPLRAISGYLNLLTKRCEGKLDSDADRFIQRSIDNTSRMQRLINDLLAYSRLTTRGRPFEPTDCSRVLDEVLEMLQPGIEETGAEITRGSLPTVLADAGQLTQLFQNLIGNGLKFRGTQPPRIHVDARHEERVWVFSVKDNGIGIDPQYAERIFLIFQRLHTVDEYPGTGIGLAICKKVVERHGGRIWVESRAGEGANFLFTIPDEGGSS